MRMTTQSVLLDFSIAEDRDIAGSTQIVEDLLNQHLKTLNETFSCLKLEVNITGKTKEKKDVPVNKIVIISSRWEDPDDHLHWAG